MKTAIATGMLGDHFPEGSRSHQTDYYLGLIVTDAERVDVGGD